MEQNALKEIPYGVSDFVTIVEQNIFYIDKTMYIPKLEDEARNLFFIRPADLARACSSARSMPTTTAGLRTSFSTGSETYGSESIPRPARDDTR